MQGYGSEVNTLDEPVWETLKRDLLAIAVKTRHVMLPNGKGTLALRDWDLWGPLLMSFLLAIVVGVSAKDTATNTGRTSLMFAVVFVIVAVGSLAVTFNAKVLGGQVSIFQAVCVLGYCMFPLVLAATVIAICAVAGFSPIVFRGPFVLACFFWASWASVGFMGALVPRNRKILSVYPVVLFYLILAWIILIVVK